jgi:hypothetical protein
MVLPTTTKENIMDQHTNEFVIGEVEKSILDLQSALVALKSAPADAIVDDEILDQITEAGHAVVFEF